MEATEFKGFRFLESLPRWEKGHFSPLEIPRRILNSLKNPQDEIPAIHLAGTNGKGTTSAFIASILKEAGFKVGQFSSPHLSEVRERCRINGELISKNKFNDALCDVAETVDWDCSTLSYFVATAAASFLCFKREEVDWNVIEVGLGGSYDATNLIEKPRCSVITSVSVDHQDVLGESLVEIAKSKAGIIKANSEVFVGRLPQAALEIVEQKVFEVGAAISEFNSSGGCRLDNESLEISIAQGSFLLNAKTEFLRSDYVHDCLMLATRICHSLGIRHDKIAKGIEKTYWPGRMEQIELSSRDKVILDGAHNLEAFEALFAQIEKIANRDEFERIDLILAMRKRCGFENCISLISRKIAELEQRSFEVSISCPPWEDSLALTRDDWASNFTNKVVNYHSQPKLILESLAASEGKKRLIVIAGSLHFVGGIKASL